MTCNFTKGLFRFRFLLGLLILTLVGGGNVYGQFPYGDSFKNATSPGTVLGGTPNSATLTAASGLDAPGAGYLRLTTNANNQTGFARNLRKFTAADGLSIAFEYYTHTKTSVEGADGFTFFLFNSSGVTAAPGSFQIGKFGGSLGYAQSNQNGAGPGVSKGYLGIGFDEFGNFATNTAGRALGFTARVPSSVTLRGDGDGDAQGGSTNYEWLATTQTTDPVAMAALPTPQTTFFLPGEVDGRNVTTGGPQGLDNNDPGYRKAEITMVPIVNGFRINVFITQGGVGPGNAGIRHHVVQNFDYVTGVVPLELSYGFAASTGGSTNIHEIRAITAVASVAKAPILVDTAITRNANRTIAFTELDFYRGNIDSYDISRFRDPNGEALVSVKITQVPTNGTLKLTPGGASLTTNQVISRADLANLIYTPAANYTGPDSFKWNATDGTISGITNDGYATSVATVNITLIPNNAPAGTDKTITSNEDAVYTFAAADFGFTDPNDTPANGFQSVTIATVPATGTLTLSGIAVAAPQTITVANIPNLVYTPAANANGAAAASFTFQVVDDGATGGANVNTDQSPNNIIFNLTAVNDLPIVADVPKSGPEDQMLTFTAADFTSKFTDVEGTPLNRIRITSLPSNGLLKIGGVTLLVGDLPREVLLADLATITFEPTLNFNGSTSFAWNGQDGTAYATAGANVNITITPVNDLPTVADVPKSGPEDQVINFTALDFTSKFTDVDGNTLNRIQITSLPANGLLKVGGVTLLNGDLPREVLVADLATITFEPTSSFNGSTSFSWNGQDGTAYATAGANVNITITPINDLPTVADVPKSGPEDQVVNFTALDFTSKFTDVDGNALNRIRITTLPANGLLKVGGVTLLNGDLPREVLLADLATITFEPTLNFNGSTSFAWNGQDGTAYATAGANVNITITPVNDLPTVADVSKSGPEDQIINFTVLDFASKFTDADGTALNRIRITTLPSNGLLKVGGVTLVNGDLPREILVADLATITFEPTLNFSGTTSFGWNGQDGTAYATAGAVVNITITPVNDLPTVADVPKSGAEDQIINFTALDFTSKFTDVDGNTLNRIRITTLPSNGLLKVGGVALTAGDLPREVLVADLATITFEPALNFNGSTSFAWNGQDGTAYATAGANVNITISPVNDLPTVADVPKSGPEDQVINFTALDFTSKFTDADGTTLNRIRITTLPSNGLLKVGGVTLVNGDLPKEVLVADLATITFEPTLNFNGSASFGWNGQDGSDYASSGAVVNITITPVNDLPTVADIPKSGAEDQIINFTALDFTSKFTDVDGNTLNRIRITTLPSNGLLKVGGVTLTAGDLPKEVLVADLATITFEPTLNFNGSTSFAWNGHDGTAYAAAGANVNITITPVNDLPTVAEVPKSGFEDQTINFTAADFTSKFTDGEGSSLNRVRITTLPTNGLLKVDGVTIVLASLPREVLAVDLAKITFEPALNFNGTTSFSWNGQDGTDYATVAANVNITVTQVNDEPTFTPGSNQSIANNAGTQSVSNWATNILKGGGPDENNQTVTFAVSATNSTMFSVQPAISSDGTLSYTPAPGASGTSTVTVMLSDNGGVANGGDDTSPSITFTITIAAAANAQPTVSSITKNGQRDQPVTFAAIDFTTKFSDPDNDALNKIQIVSIPTANGVLKLNGTDITPGQEIPLSQLGNIVFIPATGFTGGPVSFNWNGSDGSQYAQIPASVNISISAPGNNPPVAQNDNATTPEDTPVTINVLVNDSDPDQGNVLTITSATIASGTGTVSIASDGKTITFTPGVDYVGTATINYAISDANGGAASATVTVNVTENRSVSIVATEVCINDVPWVNYTVSATGFTPAANSVTIRWKKLDGTVVRELTSQPLSGQLLWPGAVVDGNGNPTAWPGWEFTNGQWVQINDGLRPQLTLEISINPQTSITVNYPPATPQCSANPNRAPQAVNDAYSIAKGGTLTISSPGVLSNDTDADNNTLTAALVSGATNGTVTVQANGSFTYTHNNGASMSDSFTYRVNDGKVNSNTATVNITISATNTPPVTVADTYEVVRNGTLSVGVAAGVLKNDTDPDGNTLSARLVTIPTNGTLTFNTNGSFIYQHTNSSASSDSFTYRAFDGTADGNIVTVTIAVTSTNTAPVATADNYAVQRSGTLTITAPGVLANDSDPEGNAITAIRVSNPSHGNLTFNANGSFSYVHNGNSSNSDSFTYKVNDGSVDGNTVTVTIAVTSPNTAPLATADNYAVQRSGTLTIAAPGVLSNDSDPEGNAITAIRVSNPSHGNLTFNANGSFSYVHNGNSSNSDSFAYKVNDGSVDGNTVTVTISITNPNNPPLIADISKTGTKDQLVPFSTADFTGKYSDLDGDPLTRVRIVSIPSSGTLRLNGTPVSAGQEILVNDLPNLTYTPVSGFVGGPVSFSWNGSDGKDYSTQAKNVNITIAPGNTPPVTVANSYNVNRGATLTIAAPGILANDTDVDPSTTLTAIKVTDPTHGTLTFNADGSFVYVHNGTVSGNDSFTYRANDGSTDGNIATVTIVVNNTNTLPTLGDITKIGTGFTPFTFTPADFTSKFTDTDGDALTRVRIVTLPPANSGILRLNGIPVTSGQEIPIADLPNLTFTTAVNWSGTTTFSWNGYDGTAYSASPATVSLTVVTPSDPNAKIGLAKNLASITPAINGTFDVRFVFTAVNYGGFSLENISIRDNLTLAFGGAEVLIKSLTAFGNLQANTAYNGTSDTELLLTASKLNAGEEALIDLVVNVKPSLNGGLFYNTATAEAISSVNGFRVTDVSTNGLQPDPTQAGDVSPAESTPIQLDVQPSFVPAGFSPNGDGMNDKFVIRNPDGKQIWLEVYNRWGNRVYKSVDYQNDWGGEVTEGFFVGRDIPDGTYYYIIVIGETDKYVGFITVNR